MKTDSSLQAGLLVSRAVADAQGQLLLQASAAAGLPAELLVLPEAGPLSADDAARVTCALLSVDVIGNSSKQRTEPLLTAFSDTVRAAPRLQWVQICSAGMDRPLFAELHARGVRLASGAGTNAKAVVQTALAGVLALARGLPHSVAAQREHRWAPLRGPLTPVALDGQQAVVVGAGDIGRGIARLLRALDVRVTGVRRQPQQCGDFDEVVAYAALDDVLPRADWLLLACPLSDITRGLIDARRLALLPAGARVVNVARGEVLDEDALVQALRGGRLGGACLDVFAPEPLAAESPLWDLPNVLLSAHSAGNSTAHQRNVIALFERNLARAAHGLALENEWQPQPAAIP